MCWVRTVGPKQPKTVREALGQPVVCNNWAARTTPRAPRRLLFSLSSLLISLFIDAPLSASASFCSTAPARPCGIKKAPRSIRLHNVKVHIPRESLVVCVYFSIFRLLSREKGLIFPTLGPVQSSQPHERGGNLLKRMLDPWYRSGFPV